MKSIFKIIFILLVFNLLSCKNTSKEKHNSVKDLQTDHLSKNKSTKDDKIPFIWEGANLYFLLVDRFNNGDSLNDITLNRNQKTGKLRNFEGGDIKGITQKIKKGYFNELGINAIWLTPIVEQIHGYTNEGTGNTNPYHGYWIKDWTAIDPNFGTYNDLKLLVDTAHQHGIRILLDAVLNHLGPTTKVDPAWPDSWIRTSPTCTFDSYESTVQCTLVDNLPDIITENNKEVTLPPTLIKKWKSEGRYEKEVAELDHFFKNSGLNKAPKNYIIKWLTDYIRELGIDGYRVDTVKHVDEDTWKTLQEQSQIAFMEWKSNNPDKVLDSNKFYMLGEVYNYAISNERLFDFGDRKVDYYAHGFNSLINFEFKYNAKSKDYNALFTKYNDILQNGLKTKSVVNYISSHDDQHPFDQKRKKTYKSAIKLILTPGISQIYYGDETARKLIVEGAEGDAHLRSFMNWEDLETDNEIQLLWNHWKKLGNFRKDHPAVGAGIHSEISNTPYIFSRTLKKDSYQDAVVVALNLIPGDITLSVGDIFPEGTIVIDTYSGKESIVKQKQVHIDTKFDIVLLAPKRT